MINGIILLVNGCKVMRNYKLWLIVGIYGGDAVKKQTHRLGGFTHSEIVKREN